MRDPVLWLVSRAHRWLRRRFVDPSRNWPRRRSVLLEYDLATRSLNGIPIEAQLEEAKIFGAADYFTGGAEDADLHYHALGLEIESSKRVIVGFRFIMSPTSRAQHSDDQAFRPATLRLCALDGRSHVLSARSTEEQIMDLLGAPTETGPVVADRVHTFLVAGNFIDTYHDPSTGSLIEFNCGLTTDADSGGRTKSQGAA